MWAKVPKCHCLAPKASSGQLMDPKLSISGQLIHYASDPIKFLGRIFEVPHDPSRVKKTISLHLLALNAGLRQLQPTHLKSKAEGVQGWNISTPLMTEDLPMSWVEKKLDVLATLYLKKWVGLARPANPALLYLPHKLGGLLVSMHYKQLQVGKESQLLTSPDHCVRQIAERSLQKDLTLKCVKFRVSVVVREVMVANPNFTKRSLCKRAKAVVHEEAWEEKHRQLLCLERGGHMFRCGSFDAVDT